MATKKFIRIEELAKSSAAMAIDQAGTYPSLNAAAESYLRNVEDTLREWGYQMTRDYVFARQCFAEAMKDGGCERQWVKP